MHRSRLPTDASGGCTIRELAKKMMERRGIGNWNLLAGEYELGSIGQSAARVNSHTGSPAGSISADTLHVDASGSEWILTGLPTWVIVTGALPRQKDRQVANRLKDQSRGKDHNKDKDN